MSCYRSMSIRLFIFFITALFASNIQAQTYASPKLICAQNKNSSNTITWENVPVGCGPFVGYKIYAANDIAGPYNLLTTINVQAQTSFSHNGVTASQIWYYFMESDFNCPGSTSKSSDTFLCTSDYSQPKIKSVSVENGKSVIRWYPSPEKQTYAYNILIPNIKILDSVLGRFNNAYTDSDQDPTIKSATYTIVSRDKCGGGDQGISEESFAHTSIFLQKTENPCKGNIDINWTKYIGWDGPKKDTVLNYKIFIGKNGAAEKLISTNNPDNRSFLYTDYIVGDSLCIRILATNSQDTTALAYSNQLCFVVNKVQKPRYFFISQIDVFAPNKILLEWITDSLANVREVIIKRGYTEIDLVEIHRYTVNGKISKISKYIDTTALKGNPIYYEILLKDSCGADAGAAVKNHLYLKVEQKLFFVNKLTWKPQALNHSTVFRYKVYRDAGEGLQLVATLNPDQTLYEDNIEALYEKKGIMCYQVVVDYSIDTLPFYSKFYSSRSNLECIAQRPMLHIPNAFRPDGVNKEFKPMIIFGNTANYSLKIFNRWGASIFESNDPTIGWNGTIGGSQAPQEEYVYLIQLNDQDGTPIFRKGTVLLLR
ncbi:MAG: gliding motility-associated C-terminal domain-containing protein [Bacteroidetes bacterium]|nr:gliding motility-associated C-terminal domain-containing protein [Bacteroidota bacterium]